MDPRRLYFRHHEGWYLAIVPATQHWSSRYRTEVVEARFPRSGLGPQEIHDDQVSIGFLDAECEPVPAGEVPPDWKRRLAFQVLDSG